MKALGLDPRTRKSPFFASTLKYGATGFHPYNGMWPPSGYDRPVNEYCNTIERAGLWGLAVQRCVVISGPDAGIFMDLLTPRDVSRLRAETAAGARGLEVTGMPFIDAQKELPRRSLRGN